MSFPLPPLSEKGKEIGFSVTLVSQAETVLRPNRRETNSLGRS